MTAIIIPKTEFVRPDGELMARVEYNGNDMGEVYLVGHEMDYIPPVAAAIHTYMAGRNMSESALSTAEGWDAALDYKPEEPQKSVWVPDVAKPNVMDITKGMFK